MVHVFLNELINDLATELLRYILIEFWDRLSIYSLHDA